MPPITISLTKKEVEEAEAIGRMRQQSHNDNHRDAIRLRANIHSEHILGATGELAFEKWLNGFLKMERNSRPGGDGGIDFTVRDITINIKTRSKEWHDVLIRADKVDLVKVYVGGWFDDTNNIVTFWGAITSETVKRVVSPTPARNPALRYLNYEIKRNLLTNMRTLHGVIFNKPVYICCKCGHYANIGRNNDWYCFAHKMPWRSSEEVNPFV